MKVEDMKSIVSLLIKLSALVFLIIATVIVPNTIKEDSKEVDEVTYTNGYVNENQLGFHLIQDEYNYPLTVMDLKESGWVTEDISSDITDAINNNSYSKTYIDFNMYMYTNTEKTNYLTLRITAYNQLKTYDSSVLDNEEISLDDWIVLGIEDTSNNSEYSTDFWLTDGDIGRDICSMQDVYDTLGTPMQRSENNWYYEVEKPESLIEYEVHVYLRVGFSGENTSCIQLMVTENPLM